MFYSSVINLESNLVIFCKNKPIKITHVSNEEYSFEIFFLILCGSNILYLESVNTVCRPDSVIYEIDTWLSAGHLISGSFSFLLSKVGDVTKTTFRSFFFHEVNVIKGMRPCYKCKYYRNTRYYYCYKRRNRTFFVTSWYSQPPLTLGFIPMDDVSLRPY